MTPVGSPRAGEISSFILLLTICKTDVPTKGLFVNYS